MPVRAGDLKNRVTVHRPMEAADDFRDSAVAFAAARGPHWMSIVRDGGGLRDYGPGEQKTAGAKGQCYASVDVRERDVLQVVAGPMKGGPLWKVLASFHEGDGGRDLRLEAYTGTAP